MRWVNEFNLIMFGMEVKVVYELDFSVEVVKVPLKFLPVKVGRIRDK